MGVRYSILAVPDGGMLMHIFLGTITGVGGGALRDVLSNNLPYIFTKHIYALASIAGALICCLLWSPIGQLPSMICGALLIFVLRCLAAHFQWNLPHPAENEELSSNQSVSLAEQEKRTVYEPSITEK